MLHIVPKAAMVGLLVHSYHFQQVLFLRVDCFRIHFDALFVICVLAAPKRCKARNAAHVLAVALLAEGDVIVRVICLKSIYDIQ